MRARVALLLLIPSALFAQQSAELAGPVKLEIRSTDSTRVLNVRVELRGALFESIGVLRPAAGIVEMSGPRGTATTPAMIELSAGTGRGSLRVPESGPELEVTVISVGAPVVALSPAGTQSRSIVKG